MGKEKIDKGKSPRKRTIGIETFKTVSTSRERRGRDMEMGKAVKGEGED